MHACLYYIKTTSTTSALPNSQSKAFRISTHALPGHVPGHTARSAVAHARRHVSGLRRAGGSVLRPAPRRCTWGPCPESSGSRGIPHRTQHTQGAALCRAALAGAGGRSCAGGRRGRPADRRQDQLQDCIKTLEQESTEVGSPVNNSTLQYQEVMRNYGHGTKCFWEGARVRGADRSKRSLATSEHTGRLARTDLRANSGVGTRGGRRE